MCCNYCVHLPRVCTCMCLCVCSVLCELLTSEVESMSSYDEEELKSALHMGTLSLLATTWKYYGHRSKAQRSKLICKIEE